MADGILKEYLVRLGLQDNMTEKLNNSLNNAGNKASKFAGSFGRQFLYAGTAVATMTVGAGLMLGKFIGKLMTTDDELNKFSKDLGVSREEAYKTKSALDVMGKSMEEIADDPRLLAQFKELRANAENIQIPDLSDGLEKVRGVTNEFLKLKQTAMAGLQWVGHYLFKYIDKPLQDVKKTLGGINDKLVKNLPEWSEKIGKALSWVVRLGTTLIRGAGLVFNAIKRIFDMIPDNVKMVMGILAALALFIRAGPLGKLMMIFSLLMLLAEDFFTYLDGGDALLGGFWKWLIDIWNELNKQGGVIEKLKEGFQKAMEAISKAIDMAIGWVRDFWRQLKEIDAVQNFGAAFSKVGAAISNIFKAVKGVLSALFGGLAEGSDKITPFLVWLISEAIPKAIGLVADIANGIALFVQKLNDLGLTEPLIMAVVGAFLAFKTIGFINGLIDEVTKSITGATNAINGLKNAQGSIQGLLSAFSGLKTAVLGYTSSVWKSITASAVSMKAKLIEKAETLYLQALYAKDAIVRGVSTAAQWAQTAATTAWNVAAGIATTVTTAFGAAVAFLTSPIGLVILAVVALIAIVVLLVKNWDKVKEFFIGLWDKIKEVFSGTGSWFKEKFTAAKDAVVGVFTGILDWIKSNWKSILLFIINPFAGIFKYLYDNFEGFRNFIDGIIEAIIGFFSGLWNTIKAGAQAFVNAVIGFFDRMTERQKAILEKIIGFFAAIWENIKSGAKAFVGAIVDFITGLLDKWIQIVSAIIGFYIGIWNTVINGVKAFIDAVISFFQGMQEKQREIIARVVGFFVDTWENVKAGTQAFISAVIDFFVGLINRIKNIIGKIVGFFSDAWNTAKNLAKSFVDGVLNIFKPLTDFMSGIGEKIKSIFGGKKTLEVETVYNDPDPSDPSNPSPTPRPSVGHADGGVFFKEHDARFVENDKPEAIIPLTKPNRAREVLGQVVEFLGGGGAANEKATPIFDKMKTFIDQASSSIRSMNQVATAGAYSNAVSNSNVLNDNRQFDMSTSFTVNDSSGNPQTTAKAIDRMQQLRTRNMKGVLQ